MKKITLFVFIIAVAASNNIFGQWARISSENIGTLGRMLAVNSNIFFYGSQNGFKLYRSSDNGTAWSSIADKFPYDVYYMYEYKNEIFAVTTDLGTGIYRFYVSGDGGATWGERSNIPGVTGNGSVMSRADPNATNAARFYRVHLQ